MPRLLIGAAAVIGGATLLGWVAAGPRIVALLDHVTTTPEGTPSTPSWFALDDGDDAAFDVGDRRYRIARTWRVVEQPPGHVSLETPEGSMVLGVVTRRWSTTSGHRSYAFAPAPGDIVSLTRRHSRVPWPRVFAFNILGGASAWWGRYVYHRLSWRKPNGAMLDVVWRDEQRLLSGEGWIDQFMPTLPVTTMRPGR